jgi:hypothetical protein
MKKRCTYIGVIIALLLVPFVLAEYEENIHEGIFLVRPENTYLSETVVPTYLSSEDLTFFACIEYDDTPVRLSVLCAENSNFVDVSATRWGEENCFIGSVNLDDFPCQDAVLAADFIHNGENQRVTKDIRINKITGALERMLNTQYEDGGWSSSLDTAFALFSLKPFADVFDDSVENGLQYLKESRNEELKCWPEDQCQISTTAMITFLLTEAGYEDDMRIIHDATVYLEKSMNYIDGTDSWTLTLEDFLANQNNTVNTSCVYGFDSVNTTLNLSRYGTETNITVTPSYYSVINVVCTENVYADLISTKRGRLIHYEGDNFTYVIPGPCWTFNNENVTCDLRATALAAGTPIEDNRRTSSAAMLMALLNTTSTGMHYPDEDIMNLALTRTVVDSTEISAEENTLILKHLLFKQMNRGGWNATSTYYNNSFYEPQQEEINNLSHALNDNYTRSIVYTGFAVQTFLDDGYDREDEVIQDAERWVSLHEESVSATLTEEQAADAEIVALYDENVSDILNDPKRTAMALFVLQQHTRPFIKSSPRVIVLDKQNISIDLVNPTTFSLEELSYSLSPELEPYVAVEEKDYLAPYSFRRITISQKTNSSVGAFGYMRIMSGSEEYAKIPVIMETYPSISIVFPQTMTVFGSTTVAQLNVTKSYHNFSCTLQWEEGGISTLSSFTIEQDGTFNLPIQFLQAGTEEKDYTGHMQCKAKTSTFTFPFTLRVTRFLTKPLSVTPSMLSANFTEDQMQFTLKNLLDESIDVTVGLREPSDYIDFSDYFISMYPGESRNVTVFITAPVGENISIVNAVIIKTFNIEERIPLQVEIINEPETKMPVWMLSAILIGSVGIVVILGYFGYSNRKKLHAYYVQRFKKESSYDKVYSSVRDYEQKEEAIAIKNMVQILKLEGVADKDVRTRLQEQGFTPEEIEAALKMKTDDDVKKPATSAAPQK